MNDGDANDAVSWRRSEWQRQAITPSDFEPATSADCQQAEAVIATELEENEKNIYELDFLFYEIFFYKCHRYSDTPIGPFVYYSVECKFFRKS